MKRLIAIQQSLRVAKDKKGYGYQYRDAEQILAAVKPALAEHKCVILCDAEYVTIDGSLFKKVTATLYGEDGKSIASAADMVKSPSDMKGMCSQQVSGSDTTYCKRYALQNLLAIDDGSLDVDSKDNPLNPKAPKWQTKLVTPAATTTAQSTKSFNLRVAEATSAIELNALDTEVRGSANATDEQKARGLEMIRKRGVELHCTYTDSEGWLSNDDLFG